MAYRTQYRLCQYDNERCVLSNKHFLPPWDEIYTVGGIRPDGERVNLEPSSWGPDAWAFLFSVADGYSNEPSIAQRLEMRSFLEGLAFALPCEKCRHNISKELTGLTERDLDSIRSVKAWLSALRGSIRVRNAKHGLARTEPRSCPVCS